MNTTQRYQRTRQLAWLIGVPLILLVIALWQWSLLPSEARFQQTAAAFQATILELEAKAGPLATPAEVGVPTTDRDGMPVIVHISDLKDHLRTLSLQRRLAPAAILCSLAALALGALGVIALRRMAAQAEASRELLIAGFLRGSRQLPVFMILMVVLLAAAAVASIAYHQVTETQPLRIFVIVEFGLLLVFCLKILIEPIRQSANRSL